MRNAISQTPWLISQNPLALDYLLASEGGVCGKFNLTNCCLQIDDEGKVIEKITDGMTNLAHVPFQTWKGWDPNNLFGGWFSAIGGFKTLVGAVGLILGACIIPPCFLPMIIRSIRSIIEVTIERKMAVHIMMLWKYQPLNQENVLYP
jgi:hypothetical protein